MMAHAARAEMAGRGLAHKNEIPIMGFQDVPQVDRITPPLTSIRQPSEELGRIAAEMTIATLSWPDRPPEERRLPPTLVVRESTTAPAGQRPTVLDPTGETVRKSTS